MKKINEIFYSLQGEGLHAGTPAVFVRFSGCNLKCPFCDTEHNNGVMMSDDDIVKEIVKYPAEWIIFTGGEPTIQLDNELCLELKKHGKKTAIETNGTKPVPKEVDFVTISPKFEFCKNADLFTGYRCDELKVVFSLNTDMKLYEGIESKHYFLQPCWEDDKTKTAQNTNAAIDYCKNNPKWRLSLQTQKITNIQ